LIEIQEPFYWRGLFYWWKCLGNQFLKKRGWGWSYWVSFEFLELFVFESWIWLKIFLVKGRKVVWEFSSQYGTLFGNCFFRAKFGANQPTS
jgi:hypothetical protein